MPTLPLSVRRTFAAHYPLYICAVLFAASTLVLASIYDVSVDWSSGVFFVEMAFGGLVVVAALIALAGLIGLARGGFPDKPAKILGNRLWQWLQQDDRLGNIVHSLAAFMILELSFTTLKESIPVIHPFAWDQTLMKLGLMIGFGHHPFQLLQPFLGHPAITAIINLFYDSWFCVMFGCFFWQAFASENTQTRMQFLLSFAFAWFIAGNLLAVVFSSAGPCFYGYLHPHSDPYASQLAYLQSVNKQWPIWSVDIQRMLWRSYSHGHGALGGISAMPSMHVTIAALLAIWGWHISRKAGLLLSAFALIIFVGSIHLAWHYTADGIAGLILAPIFWIAAGWVAKLDLRRSTSKAPAPTDAADASLA